MSGVQLRIVARDESGMRLDRWFKLHYPQVGHGQLEKFLRKGQVRVSGGRVKANRRLETGEEVRVPPISAPEKTGGAKKTYSPADRDKIRSLIIFEDDHLIALNKPFGLPVQGGSRTKTHIDAMLGALERDGERPRLVHRLDKDTGGLLIVAKTRAAAQKLSDAFQGRNVEKTYWALTAGVPRPQQGTISLAIAKRMVRLKTGEEERVVPAEGEDAKRAVSHYQVVDDAERAAFVALRPVTGRTHQLRVHTAAIGTPIVGDRKYGGEAALIEGLPQKLHLFCREMSFPHPKTGMRVAFTAPLQGHMLETWKFFGFDVQANVEWPEELR